MAPTRTLLSPAARASLSSTSTVLSPSLAGARASAIPATARLISDTPSGGGGFKPLPMPKVPGKGPRSLVEQITHLVAGVPHGLVQMGVNALTDTAVVPHVLFDLVKDKGHLHGLSTYLPFVTGMGESFQHTGARFIHPSRYLKAIKEGNIVDVVAEDVGNLAIVAGAAGKAIGAGTGALVGGAEGGVTAAEQGAATGVRGLSSVGAMAAEDLAPVGRVATPANVLENVAEATRLRPAAEAAAATATRAPFKGIAGLVARGGDEAAIAAAERVARVGEIVQRVGEAPAQILNPLLPYQLPGKALDFLGERAPGNPLVEGINRYRPGAVIRPLVSAAAERLAPEIAWRRGTEEGQKFGQIESGTNQVATEAGRQALEGAVIAREHGLTNEQSRAVLLSIDRPGFAESIRNLSDNEIQDAIDRSPVWQGVDSARRPTVDTVKEAWAYADRQQPPEVLQGMDQARAAFERQARLRTNVQVENGTVAPEQLNNELLPSQLARITREIEQSRGVVEREQGRLAPQLERQRRIVVGKDAALDELPAPPDPGQNFQLGKASVGDAAQRALYAENQRQLAKVVNDYANLAEGSAPAVEQRLAAELDRLMEEHQRLNEQLGVQVRRGEAAAGLSRAGTEAVPGQEVPAPGVDMPNVAEARRVREHAKNLAGDAAYEAHGAIDALTGGDRPIIPRKSERGGENDWWHEGLDEATKRRLQREKWVVGGNERGATSDEMATTIAEKLGGDASDITGQMMRYVDAVRRYWEAKSGRSDATIEATASALGMPLEHVQAAVRDRLADYAPRFGQAINQVLDEAKDDFANLTPDERASFDASLAAMRNDPEAVLGDYQDLLQSYLPGADIESMMPIIGNAADAGALIDWMHKGGALPETIRTKIETRTAGQNQQLGRIAGEAAGTRQQISQNVRSQRRVRGSLTAAQAEGQRQLDRAGKAVVKLDEKGQALAPYEGEGPQLSDIRPSGDVAWKRRTGTTNTGETTNPLSPAERQIGDTYVHHERLRSLEARAARLERSSAALDAKITDLPTELNRTLQDRVVENVNEPAVNQMRNVVRKMGDVMGGIVGKDGAVQLTGLVNRLARKYGFYDDALAMLDGQRGNVRSLRGEPDLPASTVHATVEAILTLKNIVMEPKDREALANSLATETFLDDMSAAVAEEYRGDRRLNAPYRVVNMFEARRGEMPPEIRVQFDDAVGRWMQRRGNILGRTLDDYSKAAPAAWRSNIQDNRGLVSSLLDMAHKAADDGDIERATDYQAMAEETATTLSQLVESGIEPQHLIGGKEAPGKGLASGAASRLGKVKVRAETARRTSLRPLDVSAYARLEADQAHRIVLGRRNALIEEHLGERADSIPEVRQAITDWATVHDGEMLPSQDIAKAAAEVGYKPIEQNARLTNESMLVPEQVYKALPENFKVPTAFQGLGKFNSKWKTWVLPFSPKWLFGNVIGNIMMAGIHGGVGPVELARNIHQIIKDQGGVKSLWDRGGVPDWARPELAQHGFTHTEHQILNEASGGTTPRTAIGRAAAWSYRMNEFVDNMARSAVNLSKLREGATSEAALHSTLKAMGDFSNMSNVERRIVREIFPFYAWMRHSIGATLRLPVESPARAAILLKLAAMYSDPEMSNDLLSRIGSKIPLGPSSGMMSLLDVGSLSPLAEANQDSGFPLSPVSLARSVSPGIKLPLQVLAGLDLNTLSQLKRPQSAGTGPPINKLLSDPIHGFGEIGALALGNSPAPIRSIGQLVLGNEQRYKTGYQVGDLTNPNAGVLATILRGLSLPAPYKIDVGALKAKGS